MILCRIGCGFVRPFWLRMRRAGGPESVIFKAFWRFDVVRAEVSLGGSLGALWGSLALSGALWGSLGFSGALWSSLRLFGALWSSLGLSGALWGHFEAILKPS